MVNVKSVTIYGIKNCDTMKKARSWLDRRGVVYEFHDYKSAGIARGMLEGWAHEVGWELLLNRSGRTFRALPEKDREDLTDKMAIALMAATQRPRSVPLNMFEQATWSYLWRVSDREDRRTASHAPL